jgi:excisionase family DNA binding protein
MCGAGKPKRAAGDMKMQSASHSENKEAYDPLFKIKEVCGIIRAERSKVYDLLKSGELTAIKLGGSTLVYKSTIDRFLAAAQPAIFRKPTLH